ncbi:hypothetical protein AAFX91_41565 [Bradyrhizobium sp. 31Argb]|uniref:hypothetical protein n=1 Tax=Bradyrhizobium sp. 31Argb TaxID=3141247 RepID=UPI003749ACB5
MQTYESRCNCSAAVLDRLLHQSSLITIRGAGDRLGDESLRMPSEAWHDLRNSRTRGPARFERAEQKGKALTEPRASAADDPTNLETPAPGESSQDQILEAWAAEAGQGDHENRPEAVRRTKAWQETAPHEPPWLDLSLLSLTTLSAALPAGLQHLNIDGNQLTSVPDILPSGLQTLHARNNWLANLPTNLPASIECLRASGNRLTSLPATLPSGSSACTSRTIS